VDDAGSAVEELVGDAALLVEPHDRDALATALRHALDPVAAARLPVRRAPASGRVHLGGIPAAHVAAYRAALAG